MEDQMKKMILVVIAFGTVSAFGSDQTCYQVSPDGRSWSRTPELLCISTVNARGDEVEISLKTGMSFAQQTIATFNYSLLSAARCIDCNQNVYGISNPSNSTFNQLSIRFNGKRDIQTGKETGVVLIGGTKMFYRN